MRHLMFGAAWMVGCAGGDATDTATGGDPLRVDMCELVPADDVTTVSYKYDSLAVEDTLDGINSCVYAMFTTRIALTVESTNVDLSIYRTGTYEDVGGLGDDAVWAPDSRRLHVVIPDEDARLEVYHESPDVRDEDLRDFSVALATLVLARL